MMGENIARNSSRCRLVSWMSFNSSMTPASSDLGEYYQML
jgi:hypothetical protein